MEGQLKEVFSDAPFSISHFDDDIQDRKVLDTI